MTKSMQAKKGPSRADREAVAAWEHVRIVVPEPRRADGKPYVSRRAMATKFEELYGLTIETDPESEYEGHLFYNPDLRSICGEVEEETGTELVLRVRTTFWLGKWGRKAGEPFAYDEVYDDYWARLLAHATSVERIEE